MRRNRNYRNTIYPTKEQLESFKKYVLQYQSYRDYLIKNRRFNTWDQKIDTTSQMFSNLIEQFDLIVHKYQNETKRENLYKSKIVEELHDRFSLCYNITALLKDTNEQAKKFYEFLLA